MLAGLRVSLLLCSTSHSGLRSHGALTHDHTGAIGSWALSELSPGEALREPAAPFKKLDESVIEENARLGG